MNILNDELKINCNKCFGLCCVALFFSKMDGFPENKESGKPCINLNNDNRCKAYKRLSIKGLKGCKIYDCFGAGQKVSQVTYKGADWRNDKGIENEMSDVFIKMIELHEMLWYLRESYLFQKSEMVRKQIAMKIDEINILSNKDAKDILLIDMEGYRKEVNILLKKTSEEIRNNIHNKSNKSYKNKTFFGTNLSKENLRGLDLSGALLIAANLRGRDLSGVDLLGADMRDADISGADLTNSLYITQFQINSAKGDKNTRLPEYINRPDYWAK